MALKRSLGTILITVVSGMKVDFQKQLFICVNMKDAINYSQKRIISLLRFCGKRCFRKFKKFISPGIKS